MWGPRPPPRTKITHGRPAAARGRSGGGRNEISSLGRRGPITVFAYLTRDDCLRGSLLNVNTLGNRLPIRSRRRRLYSPPTVSERPFLRRRRTSITRAPTHAHDDRRRRTPARRIRARGHRRLRRPARPRPRQPRRLRPVTDRPGRLWQEAERCRHRRRAVPGPRRSPEARRRSLHPPVRS